jgi:hypothetical protein
MNLQLLKALEVAGGKMMKKMTCIDFNKVLWLIAVVLVVLISQTPVQGAANCFTASGDPDYDCDGFSDSEEASPIAGVTTSAMVPDLFVIPEPASSGSLLPSDPLGTLINAAWSDIGLKVHQMNRSYIYPGTARNVTSTQKAVRVVESLYAGSYWGYSPQGNPDTISDDGASFIYTKKITDSVTGLCTPPKGKSYDCNDADGITLGQDAVIGKCIRQTVAHEVAHQLNLKYTCSPDIGCHYPTITSSSETPTIMGQTVFYVKGRGSITWYIGSQYNAADTNFQLIP